MYASQQRFVGDVLIRVGVQHVCQQFRSCFSVVIEALPSKNIMQLFSTLEHVTAMKLGYEASNESRSPSNRGSEIKMGGLSSKTKAPMTWGQMGYRISLASNNSATIEGERPQTSSQLKIRRVCRSEGIGGIGTQERSRTNLPSHYPTQLRGWLLNGRQTICIACMPWSSACPWRLIHNPLTAQHCWSHCGLAF